ncbi:MAG: CYTH domain-containing protein, partial [Burkholderiaceae bacterium]|nr:CYTH domain-containing protein [Burkholderiaceae bacterium]
MLAGRPLLRAAPKRLIRLDALYYDTADRRLQQHGLALRLRREGRRWVQTLKSEGSARGGVSQRAEWESPARTLRGKPAFDLRAFTGSPLPALLANGAARLRPLFRVRVQRTQWQCDTRGSRIAVMQDIGTIVALDRPRSRPQLVRELELELLAGSAGDLPAAALKLI